ncbi:MAG TPA: RNA-binding cell elongation regulator Jag/EloR [Candidatus Limnocylindria bacterium]|nr:RNA-binding cell elongation regulator Jag/EloR [Candidatus Limnocylindria bacterium]
MSEYKEFTGKTVEEALRAARDEFGAASLDELDFEILTPGSRGVLGMGQEPARIIAAPRSALGGAAPRREAAAATPLPPAERPPREEGERRERSDRDRGPRDRDRDRGERGGGERADRGDRGRAARDDGRGPRREAAGARSERPDRGPRRERPGERTEQLSAGEQEEVRVGRASLALEREEIQAAEASPAALAAGRDILQALLGHMGIEAEVTIAGGDTAKLDVTGEEHEKETLGALIGRKGERLSALQHLVNLMLSRKMGAWTRVLVDVEDYRGRRERQLREVAMRAAERVVETGKMLQLEPMPALERRWVHLALRNHPDVATQSIGEEPQRRVVILRRQS